MKPKQIPPELKITLLYAVIGGVWILLSDKLVALLFTNIGQMSLAQTYKGWCYTVATASLLYYLIKKNRKSLENINQNYVDIFKSAEEGIFRSSPEGHFILVNPAMAKIFGYSSPE